MTSTIAPRRHEVQRYDRDRRPTVGQYDITDDTFGDVMNHIMRRSIDPVVIVLASVAIACQSSRPSDGRAREDVLHGQFDGLIAELRQDTTRDIKGVMAVRGGRTILESYFNGDGPDTRHDIRSATKSITSTLVGIAVDRHLITDLDAPVETIVPALARSPAGATTLRAYLTMRSGLDSDDQDSLARGNENRLDESGDWFAFAAAVPRKWPQGERYVYSSLSAFIAGAAVERASGLPLATFADSVLFQPLGIRASWTRRGPRGEGVGQGNLNIRLRDMIKIGDVFLHGGSYGGRRIVSTAWVDTALSPIVRTGGTIDRYADAYGYMWYMKRYDIGGDSVTLHFASGNGGNKIYIVPQDSLVVAITSSAYGRGYGQRRSEQIILRILNTIRRGR